MMNQYMDQSVDPCHDFYAYACGGWARAHPVPPDKSVFDMFETLREMLDAALRAELDQPDARQAPLPAPAPAPAPPPRPSSPSSSPTSAPTAPASGAGNPIPLQKRSSGVADEAAVPLSAPHSDTPPVKAKAEWKWMTDGGDPASDTGAAKRRLSATPVPDATTKAKWLYQSCMNQGN